MQTPAKTEVLQTWKFSDSIPENNFSNFTIEGWVINLKYNSTLHVHMK